MAAHTSLAMPVEGAAHHATVLFGMDPLWVATSVLILAYAFIVSERLNRAIISMLGAGLMIFLGVLNQEQAINGIDFNTLFLLIGMMAIVSITRRTGVFQFVAIYCARAVKGNPRALLAVLAWITAVFSALLDNVTTVMLIVPVTLLLTDQLKISAYPFLFSQIFASNIGGTATLIGDPPNILIGSAVGFSFMDFVYNVGPASLVIMVALTVIFDVVWGRKMVADPALKQRLSDYQPAEALSDVPLLWKSLFTIGLVLLGFIAGHGHGYEPGTIALTGAAFLMLLECWKFPVEQQSHKVHDVFTKVEWETIFFFLGLFILVYGVESAGLLEILARKLMALTQGDIEMTGIIILWSSAIFSAIVDNIPFVATMIPLISSTAGDFGGAENLEPLWWCLSLGACLGGNGTLVGASANVMVSSFAERAGQRIAFLTFMKGAFPLMLVTIAMAHVYVLWAFF